MANWDEKVRRCLDAAAYHILDPNIDVILHKSRLIEIIRSEGNYAAQRLRVEVMRVLTSRR